MCVQTQRSSEEAFQFFGRNLRFLEEAFRFVEEAFQFAAGAAPQTQFGKAFQMSASYFLMRTVPCACPLHIEFEIQARVCTCTIQILNCLIWTGLVDWCNLRNYIILIENTIGAGSCVYEHSCHT